MGGTQTAGQSGNAGASGSPAPQATLPNSPTDTGAASAGSSGELFRVAQIDRLRVLINVPQENSTAVHAGQPASLTVMEFAGRQFGGTVTRTSSSLDPTTRTLLTEVQVPNPQFLLLPGMYAQVRFVDTRPSPPLLVPGDSVIVTSDGLQVAVLQDLTPEDRTQLEQRLQPQKKASGKEAQQQRQKAEQEIQQARKIAIRTVQVGRDYGTETEITAGLQAGEIVVVNPGDDTRAGAFVLPRQAPPIQGEGGQQSQGELQGQAGGIGSPSMAAPTLGRKQGSQQQQGQKGKGTGKNDKGDKK
jgi:membrane fusion protein (multidrug efflux system)